MAKSKTATAKPVGSTATWSHTIRETVESIILALILAFLFRTFEAEAFVIPTGSMAPTLQGRHKDIRCPKCGYEYRVGASEEVDDTGNRQACSVENVTCPMCRYTQNVDPADPANRSGYPSYNGDRIIVNKFAYDVSDPQRWDVVVFKYPEDAKTNYIKRLVGTPNERIRILNGDIYTAPLGSNDFQIARKPPEKLNAMLQPVYDNDFVAPELIKAGLPARWQPWNPVWKTNADFKSFSAENPLPGRAWLRYQHILPVGRSPTREPYDDWQAFLDGKPFAPPQPSLIDDFYAYNDADFTPPGCSRGPQEIQHWVGDLALDFQLDAKTDRGAITLELVKGGVQFRCQIDLATGEAKLSISGLRDFAPVGQTPLRRPGKFDVSFSNVDQQLLLSVNGQLISFDAPTTYQSLSNTKPVTTLPVAGSNAATDLSPAGIAVEDGASVIVNHLKIRRDIYYTSDPSPGIEFTDASDRSRILDLHVGQFFMLGDNSPRSKDGRYWKPENYVDRRLLIGKALFVYWPHSFNYVELGSKKIPFPFWPNFQRMRFVR